MKKRILSPDERVSVYKRRYYVLLCILITFISVTGYYIYLNYDYLLFKHFISQHYIYTGALDELYKKELKTDVGGKYYSYFDNVVISVMTKSIREINNDRYTYLYTPESFIKYRQDEKDEASHSEFREIDDKTAYLRITNFSSHTKKYVQDRIKELEKYRYLVLDLRDNRGGDTFVSNYFSELFLRKDSIIGTDKMRFLEWTYKSGRKPTLSYDRMAILQNRNSASASEMLIASLKDNMNNVTTIGETTFGKGIGQFTLDLRRGFAVKATTMLWYTPKGENIHGSGIKPDIEYKGQDALSFAAALLSK